MAFAKRTPEEVLSLIEAEGVEVVDFRFSDLPGLMQHYSLPAHELTLDTFEEGSGFDGSSIRGFQEIQESDMLLVPDPNTAVIDPFRQHKTLNLNCFVRDPVTGESYSRDPRYIAKKAEDYLVSTGVADTAYFGPEAEFFIFNDIRFDQNSHEGYYYIDSVEGVWNSGTRRGPQPRVQTSLQGGLLPRPAHGPLPGSAVGDDPDYGEAGHRDRNSAPRGRHRRAGGDRHALRHVVDHGRQAHALQVRGQERGPGQRPTATFMPKPIFADNGSGMHVHSSLWKGGEPLFYSELGYAGLSDIGRWYIGGLLTHAPAILAFAAPTTNSYKRLVPGYEAPVNLVYSQRNRSAACRIPLYSKSPKAKRVEFRCPDPSCNPYLAFSAILMAGLDGVQNKIEPPDPVDKDLYDLPPEELAQVPTVPGSLEASLAALEADSDFLRTGGVFTEDLIETWISYKREHEIDPVRLRPHPWEFALYYDI